MHSGVCVCISACVRVVDVSVPSQSATPDASLFWPPSTVRALQVSFNGPMCCLSFMAEGLLKSSMQSRLPEIWSTSMLIRGYERADKKKKSKGGQGHALVDEMAKARKHGAPTVDV